MGVHVPLGVRAHAAPRRSPARLPVLVHDLRPGRRGAPHRLRAARPQRRHEAVPAPVGPRHDQRGEEREHRGRGVRRAGQGDLRAPHRRRVPRVPEPPAQGGRDGLRRPAAASPCGCCATTPRCSRHYRRRFRHVLVDEYQDTNAVQNELVVDARHRAPQRLRRRRRRPVGLRVPGRRHPQHPRVRERLPRRHGDRAGAELPLDPDDPRRGQRGHRQQPRPQAQGAVDRRGRRPRHHPLPRRRRDRRGAVGGARDRQAARRRRPPLGRRCGLLPHQRPEPGARGVPDAGGHPLQGHRRHPLLRPARDQGRAGLPAGGGEPGRRGVGQAGAQRAEAGHRRLHGRPPRRVGRRAGDHVLRGAAASRTMPASAVGR